MQIIVASLNPVKIECARRGFAKMFPGEPLELRGVEVPSGVSRQPFGSEETLQGALNRARNAREISPSGQYWVGVEGGVEYIGKELAVFAWVVVLTKDQSGKGRTGTFFLPASIEELVHGGMELGDADDVIFGRTNSKQANGAIGLLTEDAIDRPLGSRHPRHGFIYPVNYGYLPGVLAPDGEELDAYVLGVSEPLAEYTGLCIAVIQRSDDDDDKLVIAPPGVDYSNEQIRALTDFQEQWFASRIVR